MISQRAYYAYHHDVNTYQPKDLESVVHSYIGKQGLDVLTIKNLGRWESLEMVQRYTRSITFQDSLRFYKTPLS